jgi:hypothetical protein
MSDKQKSKHTPGPWYFNVGGWCVDQGGIWTSDQDDIAYLNYEVCGPDDDGFADPFAATANAHLIAAAPDLLEALELVVMEEDWYDASRDGMDWKGPPPVWLRRVRAAIAKAKGETK